MPTSAIQIEESWKRHLAPEFDKSYMKELRQFLKAELSLQKEIYPKGSEYFAAFNLTPFEQVKVVILGQDPYHGPGQAHGLCFSVKPGVPPPPSLKNIYKELQNDLGLAPVKHGYLESWARQGVLLLNSVLSVEKAKAASHQKRGWELFTDQAIRELNECRENIAFVLWGSYAQKKGAFINRERHLVLESVHPSPLSSHRGFFGSKPFSQINKYLTETGQSSIDWALPNEAETTESVH